MCFFWVAAATSLFPLSGPPSLATENINILDGGTSVGWVPEWIFEADFGQPSLSMEWKLNYIFVVYDDNNWGEGVTAA